VTIGRTEVDVNDNPLNKDYPPLPHLLDETEAAKYLGMSLAWMQQDRVSRRRVPYIKIGRAVRYRVADLIAFVERCKVGGLAT
jgi:hypothetical protein